MGFGNPVQSGGFVGTADANLVMGSNVVTFGTDPADAGEIRLPNTGKIAWEADVAGTDSYINHNSSEKISLVGTSVDIAPGGDTYTFGTNWLNLGGNGIQFDTGQACHLNLSGTILTHRSNDLDVLAMEGNATTGAGLRLLTSGPLTTGTMTYATANKAMFRAVQHKITWTNAMVTALGAVTSGDITVCTLPAKTIVKNMYLVIGTAETALTSLTVAVGRTGATYIDYIVASDAKALANTVYGDASGERGTNLTGYDLPSFTATTDIKMHLISGVENLSAAVACTGTIYIETEILL